MSKIYQKNIAVFMMVLVLTVPFYISSAFAQSDYNLPNPAQACIEKSEKTHALVEMMDNDIISILESTFQVLHALSAMWEFTKYVLDTIILALYATGFGAEAAKLKENYRNVMDNPFAGLGGFGILMHYLVTCELSEDVPTLCNVAGDYGIPLDPFDNIYVAMGCLCLPGILFNMKKLQTIYKTYNCCVEEACKNGLGAESCDRKLSETECMFWGKGSMMGGLVKMLMGIGTGIITKYLIAEWTKKIPPWMGTLISLGMAPFKIQSLQSAIEKMQNSFSEPTCEDLSFDKIKEDASDKFKNQICRYEQIDLNNDGIYDLMEYRCSPAFA